MPRPLLLPALLAMLQGADGATIEITYNAVPSEAQAAIAHAAGIWEEILVSPVPIKAVVNWVPMGNLALGITFPNGRRDFSSAPLPLTWYASALANSIAEEELNPGESDFDIFLNSSTDWYHGTDGLPAAGQHDLVSVALHEMGHGLGFVGLSKKEGEIGSFGLLVQSDFAPLAPSFPWPQLDTLPGIFDRFLAHPQDGPLDLMDNPGTALGSAMTSNQLRFNGAMAMAANNGNGPRIYSPVVFALGSSCVHLNESTYPAGNANELMTPFSAAGDANHWPGPLCLAMLQDIGWVLAPAIGIDEGAEHDGFTVHPVPATDQLTLDPLPGAASSIIIRDVRGRVLRTVRFATTISIADLPSGTYVLQLQDTALRTRFVKY